MRYQALKALETTQLPAPVMMIDPATAARRYYGGLTPSMAPAQSMKLQPRPATPTAASKQDHEPTFVAAGCISDLLFSLAKPKPAARRPIGHHNAQRMWAGMARRPSLMPA